jgi:hypothetical protein
MNTCKTCKHWSGPNPMDQYNLHGSARCNHPKVGPRGDDEPDGATDGEAYDGIFTSPDFGCIHYEPKETTP